MKKNHKIKNKDEFFIRDVIEKYYSSIFINCERCVLLFNEFKKLYEYIKQ